MKKYVLDANALLDFLEAGPGAQRVRTILHETHQDRAVSLMSVLNWGKSFTSFGSDGARKKPAGQLAVSLAFPFR